MKRREFLAGGACLAGAAFRLARAGGLPDGKPLVMTVEGFCDALAVGPALSHEHVLVDFIGADRISPDRYDPGEAFTVILPYLRKLKAAGCRALAECTPAFLGRDPLLLLRLSRNAEIGILTNTGLYGAAGDRYLPAYAWNESADELAERWIREWEDGIDGTGVRPGFIKIGVDPGPLSGIDARLVRAAARTHLRTGLTIMSHTGPAEPAFAQLGLLEEEGVAPSSWIWTHAQAADDFSDHLQAAAAGAWIAFDGLNREDFPRYAEFLVRMKQRNRMGRVLLSHDAGWYSPGEEGGGDFRGYTLLFAEFLPYLRERGFTEQDLRQVMVLNPAEAFSIRSRPRNS